MFMLQFTKYINNIMAANISDTDVILDTEGITVPECAHGMTFSNLFHAQIIVTGYFIKKWQGIAHISYWFIV